MYRRALVRVVSVIAGLALAPSASWYAASAFTAPAPAAAVSIPFEWVNRHVIMQVTVNRSRPLAFVFDTGARLPILKLDRAKELGLTLQGQVQGGGAGPGRVSGSFVRNASMAIPGVPGFSQPLTLALPLALLSPALGQEIDGIIGGEFIKQFVVELDYEAHTITLHDKSAFRYAGPGETIPIQFNSDGHPVVRAEVTPLGGEPIAGGFLLDLGAGGALVLHSPFVAKHQLPGPELPTVPVIGAAGAGGDVTGKLGRVSALKVGSFRIAGPIALFAEDTAGAFANAALAGNIGGQIANRFRVFLDYGRNRIILEPSARVADPFERAFGGMAVRAEAPNYRTFRITNLLANFPASEAGLQKDDIISAIDGRPAEDLTLTQVLEMLERPATYDLTIRRGDEILKVAFTPKKMP